MNFEANYKQYETDCKHLINIGYLKTNFAFAVGSGEDENDDYVYIKNDITLEWDYTTGLWHKHKSSVVNYSNFATLTGELINIYDLI
jgi:hypothetical protein